LPLLIASAEEAVLMLKKMLSAFTIMAALGGSLVVPATASAQGITVRFYDRSHRDYHRWTHDEDLRYREYLRERHQRYLAFERANRRRQLEYWRWRHEREEHERR
jgi:hypothetical protein